MDIAPALARMSDGELVAEVARLAQREHAATADLIASLVELDKRRLYLAEGFPSLFAYCTQRLHLSEHAPITVSRRRGHRSASPWCSSVSGKEPSRLLPSACCGRT